jgi:hypothetical protein
MKIVKNFLAISMNWSRDWLNKYVEKLTVLVMHATTNAKKSNRQTITSAINNNLSIEDLIIEKANAIEKSDDSTHQDSSAVLVTFITLSASRIVSVLTTLSASSVVTNSTTSRVTKKRHEFILKNNDSSLKSRNINSVMREIIIEKINRSQNSNRSRREAAIKSEIFRRNNLKHLQQWNLIKNLISYVNIFKWNELLNNHQKIYHHSVIYCYFINHQ